MIKEVWLSSVILFYCQTIFVEIVFTVITVIKKYVEGYFISFHLEVVNRPSQISTTFYMNVKKGCKSTHTKN